MVDAGARRREVGSAGVGRPLGRDEGFDRRDERSEIPLDHLPQLGEVDVHLVVHEPVAHADDVAPRQLGERGEHLGRDPARRLADVLE